MVQGVNKDCLSSKVAVQNWDNNNRKSGFDAMQKIKQEKEEREKKNANNSHGAWGPTFKNQSNFKSMHFC